jgi:hypothetical protein
VGSSVFLWEQLILSPSKFQPCTNFLVLIRSVVGPRFINRALVRGIFSYAPSSICSVYCELAPWPK